MVIKEKVHELVRLFYQSVYKTFYINSKNGNDFSKTDGVFVSLGMTTSMKVLENIRDFLGSYKSYKAKIVEIGSKKVGDQYLNWIVQDNPSQYRLTDLPTSLMGRDKAIEELEGMKQRLNVHSPLEIISEYSYKVSKLQYLIDRLDESNGWNSHMIQKDGNGYRIYHLYVNYEKREGIEYRIGILVTDDESMGS